MKILWNDLPRWEPKSNELTKLHWVNKAFFFSFLFQSFTLFAQTNLVGQVLDAQTKEPLVYVNIGLVGKDLGTISDEEGYFSFEVDPSSQRSDSLRFSMLGYESKTYLLADYLAAKPFEILLEEEAFSLDEVVVLSPKKKALKGKLLGNKTKSNLIYTSFTTNRLGNEMGIVIRSRKDPMELVYFEFNIVENDYGPIRFRLNLYNLKDGLPHQNLLKENVFIDTDLEQGVVRVDLTPYDLVLQEDFFIALEWIEDLGPGKLYFSGGFFGNPLIARAVSQGEWKKIENASIGMQVFVNY